MRCPPRSSSNRPRRLAHAPPFAPTTASFVHNQVRLDVYKSRAKGFPGLSGLLERMLAKQKGSRRCLRSKPPTLPH